MPAARLAALTAVCMLAFAGNSLLCRIALKGTAIDPASFTAIRIVAGALVLVAIAQWRRMPAHRAGSWTGAFALFAYAATFSYAYAALTAGTGALLLFAAVQATMIGWGVWRGERLGLAQVGGLVLAGAGLVGLVLPGISAPPLGASLVMVAAGSAWGAYSLLGKGAGDPTQVTAGNFLRGAVPSAVLVLVMLPSASWDPRGVAYALASGGITSGLGYVLWYSVLPKLRATTASIVQLSVPVIAAFGGVLLLAEPLSARLALASMAVLGGIAIVIAAPRRAPPA